MYTCLAVLQRVKTAENQMVLPLKQTCSCFIRSQKPKPMSNYLLFTKSNLQVFPCFAWRGSIDFCHYYLFPLPPTVTDELKNLVILFLFQVKLTQISQPTGAKAPRMHTLSQFGIYEHRYKKTLNKLLCLIVFN